MLTLDPDRLPEHVAIIMDGNGRWAHNRGLTRVAGHRRGKDAVRAVVETARRLGIRYLSLYAFSTENWYRPRDEVSALMGLLRHYLASELKKLMKHQIRLIAIGNPRRLPPVVRKLLRETIHATRNNTGMTVVLALSYGAREEIAAAARAIARKVEHGQLSADRITPAVVADHLATAGMPDPDLLIRTGGELRVSNFLLWQLAYTEIFVTPTLWPDFREREFLQALASYQERQRRFGRTPDQAERERLRAAY
jgi:undecaprenyl diphosphate synthase